MTTEERVTLDMKPCKWCGSFSVQSRRVRSVPGPLGGYYVHCFNEFSTATFDCDMPDGPESADDDESIRLWNRQQESIGDP